MTVSRNSFHLSGMVSRKKRSIASVNWLDVQSGSDGERMGDGGSEHCPQANRSQAMSVCRHLCNYAHFLPVYLSPSKYLPVFTY